MKAQNRTATRSIDKAERQPTHGAPVTWCSTEVTLPQEYEGTVTERHVCECGRSMFVTEERTVHAGVITICGRRPGRCGRNFIVAMIGAVFSVQCATAMDAADPPRLLTHEGYVEDVTHSAALPINEPLGMFAYVLNGLTDRVKVYPTENYYYFTFVYNGLRYAGNIRLDARDRDQGKVHFAYYEDLAEWKGKLPVTHVVLGKSDGVAVEALKRLVYRVSFRQKTVTFELNDLSKVMPPESAIAPGETYLGPIYDESAIRFFLVYSPKIRNFHYILDETVNVADTFFLAESTDRILIGKRTGFAFYRDHHLDRKILIGVFEANATVNNYFDGPFDQLPDNFIEGNMLRQAILEVEPGMAGKIDRLGGLSDGSSRFLIAPYLEYHTEKDLLTVHSCATSKVVPSDTYYNCFVFGANKH